MARTPKRSPSSFSRVLSSTCSSLLPASSSYSFVCLFSLSNYVSCFSVGLDEGLYLFRSYKTFINPANMVTPNNMPKIMLVMSVLGESYQVQFDRHTRI